MGRRCICAVLPRVFVTRIWCAAGIEGARQSDLLPPREELAPENNAETPPARLDSN